MRKWTMDRRLRCGGPLILGVMLMVSVACNASKPSTPTAPAVAPVPPAAAIASMTSVPPVAPVSTAVPSPSAAEAQRPVSATNVPVAAAGAPPPGAIAVPKIAPAVSGTSSLPPIADAADKARPAVVFIAVRSAPTTARKPGQPGQSVPQGGIGSGVIFDPRGFIVTNYHVIEGGQQIKVVLPDGRDFDAKVIGSDAATDLAVIKVEGANLPVAVIGDSDKLRVGEWVVAIGNALGLEGGPTVSAGIVSALGRSVDESESVSIENAIQTDAAINPGNSGGPLINMRGEVVGINTLIAAQIAPNQQAQNIGFAISITRARPIVDELMAKGRVDRPYFGVSITKFTPAIAAKLEMPYVDGIVLMEVSPGSPAAKAGLKQGDVLTAVGGDAMSQVTSLRDALAKRKVGDRVEVMYQRAGKEQKTTIALEARPAQR